MTPMVYDYGQVYFPFGYTDLGNNMRHLPLKISVASCILLWMVTTAAGAEPPATLIPEYVLTKSPPGLAELMLDALPVTGKELTSAVSVEVGDKVITPSAQDSRSVTFLPPRRDTAGDAEVNVKNAQGDVLAAGRLKYVEPSSAPPSTEDELQGRKSLAIFYVVIILLFPFALMVFDLQKAYRFAYDTRKFVIARAAADGLTLDELKLVLAELSQSPPGIPGLARNSIAFMLMMILGVAIVHVLVVDPPGKDIPAGIDRILVLLTGLLTSVVSFYFGSRAAEAAQQAANAGSPADTGSKPTPVSFVPKSGKPGEPVTISGAGFGTEKGTVSFGDVAADMTTATWADREVTVNVPAAAKAGKVRVMLTPQGTDRKLISSAEFEVAESVNVASPTNNEGGIDGCDVAITDATPDKDLPAAEGGVQK